MDYTPIEFEFPQEDMWVLIFSNDELDEDDFLDKVCGVHPNTDDDGEMQDVELIEISNYNDFISKRINYAWLKTEDGYDCVYDGIDGDSTINESNIKSVLGSSKFIYRGMVAYWGGYIKDTDDDED